jgi:hypothetical protein
MANRLPSVGVDVQLFNYTPLAVPTAQNPEH